ncbi:hypothetical protein Esti_005456 [Eimeria stiedai]
MTCVRQFLVACTVACSLAEAAFESKDCLPTGVRQLEEKQVAESEALKPAEESGGSFADGNREGNTAEPSIPLKKLALGVDETPGPSLGGVRTPRTGRGRFVRRQTSQGEGGGFGARRLPAGVPITASFEEPPGSPTSSSNRPFSKTHPPHESPKRCFPHWVVRTILLLVAIAWLVRQVKAYRRAQASLELMRGDLDQLLQAERNRTVNKSTGIGKQLPPKASLSGESGQGHGTEAEENARNAELVAELQAARARLAELHRILEEEEARSDQGGGGEQGEGKQQALRLTHEDALKEIAKLENDAARMRQQRQDLVAVMKLREVIKNKKAALLISADKVKKISSSLGDPAALFRTLLELEQAFERLRNEQMLADTKVLKKKLAEASDDAKKVCVWEPALTEWSLEVEKDRLREELSVTREKGSRPMTALGAALAKLSEFTSFASNSLFSSVNLMWKAVDAFRSGEGVLQQDDSGVGLVAVEVARARRDEEKLREDVEKLKKEVTAAEAELLAETQLAGPLHAQDASSFEAWLAGKKEEARAAAQFVVAGLQSLATARPPDAQASVEATRAFTAAVESSISKAISALDYVTIATELRIFLVAHFTN